MMGTISFMLMKKQQLLIALACVVLLAIGIWSLVLLMRQRNEMQTPEEAALTLEAARALTVGSVCADAGEVAAEGTYDADTKAWSFGMTLRDEYDREGCEPRCVVNADPKIVELVWDCVSPSPEASASVSAVPANELITVSEPNPGDQVQSPLTVSGRAKGNWFFEGSFPVRLVDGADTTIAAGVAQAQSDWMTTDFVNFAAKIDFAPPSDGEGFLVLEKDNPSGLPENANEVRIPVRFGAPAQSTAAATEEIKLYYYNPELDKDADGNILCSDQGLVAVTRPRVASQTEIADAIEMLISGVLSPEERADGISTEFPLPGFTLQGADLQNGELTLRFLDPQNKTTGGSCRVTILWAQINATAKQFAEVQTVRFEPEGLFQP